MTTRSIPRWLQCGMLLFSILRPAIGFSQGSAAAVMRFSPPPPPSSSVVGRSVLAPLKILALRVAFEEDSNLSTTGTGRFLSSVDSLDISPVPCDGGFLVDPPPHNSAYFSSQLQALDNYYDVVTGGNITFDLAASQVFPSSSQPLTIGPMVSYTTDSEDADSVAILLIELLQESLNAAENAGAEPLTYDVIIIFHAGLGQDFNYLTLDPTPRDIPSTYVDRDMIQQATGSSVLTLPSGGQFDLPALILPEGQNHIYYDIANDIFFGQNDLCDAQIGLTGTLALLVGYALGLPPLFDTEAGETAVGQFDLMDVGSGNGQGVIPAPPSAWMRNYMGWETAGELLGSILMTAHQLPGGVIGKVTLGAREYLLVENRLNWVLPGVDMDSLRFRNSDTNISGNFDLPNYFDYLVDSAGAIFDIATNVIVSVPNYDIGLPGSGLLIWHIDEDRYNSAMVGINNDRENRAVSLLEADGAVDIGFPTTALFADPSVGWRWDMWYAGNPAWFDANPGIAVEEGAPLQLSSDTRPPLELTSGGKTSIEITAIGQADSVLAFSVSDAATVTRLPEGGQLLGFNGQDWVWRLGDSLWLGETNVGIKLMGFGLTVSEHDAPLQPSSGIWVIDNSPDSYVAYRLDSLGNVEYQVTADGIIIATNPTEYPSYNDGYLNLKMLSSEETPDSTRIKYVLHTHTVSENYPFPARGDLDGDGHEEWLSYTGTGQSVQLNAYSSVWHWDDVTGDWAPEADADSLNLLPVDGFPVKAEFTSYLLIANLLGDILPEIIAIESGDIVVFSHDGIELLRLGRHGIFGGRFLMHMTDGRVGLANYDRIHWFTPDEQNPQWVTRHGSHSRGYRSRNDGIADQPQPAVLDKSRVYNYPNPVMDGRTTIRFYVGEASSATIRIYTVDGHAIDEVVLSSLWQNNYNEWVWNVGSHPGGLYYGMVKVEGTTTESALIKIAVVR